jgi:hypothetical protein
MGRSGTENSRSSSFHSCHRHRYHHGYRRNALSIQLGIGYRADRAGVLGGLRVDGMRVNCLHDPDRQHQHHAKDRDAPYDRTSTYPHPLPDVHGIGFLILNLDEHFGTEEARRRLSAHCRGSGSIRPVGRSARDVTVSNTQERTYSCDLHHHPMC